MLSEEPNSDPDGNHAAATTWKRLGPVDLDEINQMNPIDYNQDLKFGQKEFADGA